MNRASRSIWFQTAVWIGYFFLSLMIISHGQDFRPSAGIKSEKTGGTEKQYKIRVAVDEVRLDAVVLDSKGRQVTDLTADDFEIRQDGQLQQITSCTYINNYRPQPAMQAVSKKDSKAMPPLPAPMLEREDVRRMIGFVVDNLGMSFENVYYARMALTKFVETQMQPGDLVAIVQTAGGSAARQLFSNNKEYLLRAIKKLEWYMDPRIIKRTATQYMAIDYFLKALYDMPGRKTLILVTAQPMMPSPLMTDSNQRLLDWSSSNVDRMYIGAETNLLADKALRAGVVIHTMDITGLQGPEVYDSNFGADKGGAESSPNLEAMVSSGGENPNVGKPGPAQAEAMGKRTAIRYSQSSPGISEKTGGLFVQNQNWFINGLGTVHEALKGYYMLTYTPPPGTFRSAAGNRYHRTEIRVKRPGLTVHTRDGFFGTTQSMDASLEAPITVRDAIYYPFRYNDLEVNLASGYIDDPKKGYLLRYHMHLDGKNLSIVEEKGGVNSVFVDVACITSSMDKFVQDAGNLKFEFRIKNENVPYIRKYGLRFSLDLPVKDAGAYYVRAAVRDQVSGRAGSAYQFIDIPNLKKDRLALSNIFIMNRDEDAPWVPAQTREESRNLLYPDMRRDPRRSPAIRNYLPGESFEYAAVIYNAQGDEGKKPELESQFALYGNGKEQFKSESEAVDLNEVSDFKRIPIRMKLYLGDSVQPGDYILVLQVTDKRAKEKNSLAMQALDFRILGKTDSDKEKKSEVVEKKEITLPPEILSQYVGTYKMGPEVNAAITLEDGRLFAQDTGRAKLPLYPESETKFFVKAMADAENEFVKDEKGNVTHMIVRRRDNETKASRISSKVAERKEIILTPEVLKQYVGTYRLESGLEMNISLEGDYLYSQIPQQKMLQLCPETETKFFLKTVADTEHEFVKNSKGNITHMIIRQEGKETIARRISKKVQKWKA